MPTSDPPADVVQAAGAVIWRSSPRSDPHSGPDREATGPQPEVVLIHRDRYDDWTLPKGKLDPGEALPSAAVREVAEETGLTIRLGVPLSEVTYLLRTGHTKQVSYWTAEATDGDIASYVANHEVDRVEWVPVPAARERLSHDHDRAVLTEFTDRYDSGAATARPLVVLRHAAAKPRTRWSGDDRRRTLTDEGLSQARGLVSVLGAWGVRHVVTSDSARCVQTVLPYADSREVDVVLQRRLTEEDADRPKVRSITRRLLGSHRRAVICTHRTVLPWVFDALGLDDPHLKPGGLVVLHRRDGEVVATERHLG